MAAFLCFHCFGVMAFLRFHRFGVALICFLALSVCFPAMPVCFPALLVHLLRAVPVGGPHDPYADGDDSYLSKADHSPKHKAGGLELRHGVSPFP